MKRVTGIGGIFFKSADPKRLMEWYKTHLGIEASEWGWQFNWESGQQEGVEAGYTAWSAMKDSTDYFAPSKSALMINYRVDDLDALLAVLKTEGVEVLPKTEESDYGKFGWVMDPDGNKVELWEPPKVK